MKYIIGIDPGLTETGVVLYDDENDQDVLSWSTFSAPNTGAADVSRVVSLAAAVVNRIMAWITEYKIEQVDICIELPIYNKKAGNVQGLIKQARLLEEIESGIFHIVAGELKECWVTEVNPVTSKTLATNYGRATKAEMIAASPFKAGKAGTPGATVATLEAIADAWAHGQAAWDVAGMRLDYCKLTAAELKERFNAREQTEVHS